jgi:transposase
MSAADPTTPRVKRQRSKLSDEQSRRLTEHFVAGTPARTAAELVGVNRNTARLFYHKMRQLIAQRLAQDSPFEGKVEVDESTVEQRSTRRAAGKLPVFALVKHGGKVYTAMVLGDHDAPPVPRPKVQPDAIVYADPPTAGGVMGVSRFQHRRVHHRPPLASDTGGIDSIENFWNQAKRHMRRYNGIPHRHFHLFLKECEWRFNYGSPKQLLINLKYWTRSRRSAR